MGFFEFYLDIDKEPNSKGEVNVCCPFPHESNGFTYYEERPSMSVNLEKRVFCCHACGKSGNEADFMSFVVEGMTKESAKKLLQDFYRVDLSIIEVNHPQLYRKDLANHMEIIRKYRLEQVVNLLDLGWKDGGIAFPIRLFGKLVDYRIYRPGQQPKMKSQDGAFNTIYPFDLWYNDQRPTLLCAGEKDMAIARSYGFNAITFTGGERSFPANFGHFFRGREVYIIYDNDQAGREGAEEVAYQLKKRGATPYIVTGHYEVCVEKGEDLWDFFVKYEKTADDLHLILKNTPEFTQKKYEEVRNRYFPLVKLSQAVDGTYTNKNVSSRVVVVSGYTQPFSFPERVDIKVQNDKLGDRYYTWEAKVRPREILSIIEVNDNDKKKFFRGRYGIERNEKAVMKEINLKTIYKYTVADDEDAVFVNDENSNTKSDQELVIYSFQKLEQGEKYRIYYRPVSHPKTQAIVGIVMEAEKESSLDTFQVNESVKDSLKVFQVNEYGNVHLKMNELYERAKGFIGSGLRQDIFFASELVFHSPLQFRFGGEVKRGTIDGLIIGDPETGKSHTAKKMVEMYGMGTFVSMKTASTASVIGGANKDNTGGYKTRLGILPRSHKGLIVFEEMSGIGKELIKQMTEIRSSGQVILGRVDGFLRAPCVVRMLATSNQANVGGIQRPINDYPDGIHVIKELIPNNEDIRRYDYIMVIAAGDPFDPLEQAEKQAYDEEAYRNRIRWIWSRTLDQVVIPEDVQQYIVKQANYLRDTYGCVNAPLFGNSSFEKVARLATAVAGVLVSTDESFEKIIVKKEHVDWVVWFYKKIYDNETFRLREYVQRERRYETCDDFTVTMVQQLYKTHHVALDTLVSDTRLTFFDLETRTGIERDKLKYLMGQLTRLYLVRHEGNVMIATGRLKKAYDKIDKNINVQKVGV